MSDANGLKELPMVSDVNAWDSAIKTLRHSFGQSRSLDKLFRRLFSKEQGEKDPMDVFVSNARVLLLHVFT